MRCEEMHQTICTRLYAPDLYATTYYLLLESREKKERTEKRRNGKWEKCRGENEMQGDAPDYMHQTLCTRHYAPDLYAKLTEHVDLRAAKYLLSLKEDEFKNLYLERAKKKAEGRPKRGAKPPKEKDVEHLVRSDRRHIRQMSTEFIKGKGSVQRKYSFKAPKAFGRRFTRGLQGVS